MAEQLILFFYGLSFFSLGVALGVFPRRENSSNLSKHLESLIAFGLTHAASEWMSMFDAQRPRPPSSLGTWKVGLLAASFLFLLHFSASVIAETKKCRRRVWPATIALGSLWLLACGLAPDLLRQEVFARYLLGFPAAALAAYAFAIQSAQMRDVPRAPASMKLTGAAWASYAVASGLIVPNAPFFPASAVNSSWFLRSTGFPVQILRAVCALVVTACIIRILMIFDREDSERRAAQEAAFVKAKMERERAEERLRLENRMHQSEKLAAIGQLAAGVAHEINNPLGVILGFSQAVLRQVNPGDRLELPIKSIEREALRCKKMVQNLLTFSRASRSTREAIDLNQVVEQALPLIMAQAKIGGIEVKTDLAVELPPLIGDRTQIEQVIVNLAKNGIDAMPNVGSLSFSTEELQDTPTSWICLKITDTGVGIPADAVSRIFDPFFTTKPVGQGTGLGLSLVSEIMAKHSGSVNVDSRPGLTTFTIKFPAAPHSPEAARLPRPPVDPAPAGAGRPQAR